MAETVQLNPFARLYAEAFPPKTAYGIDSKGTVLVGKSSKDFSRSRGHLMHHIISGKEQKTSYPQALLAENVVNLALQPVMGDEFKASLAPQTIEWDVDGKGVDVLISDPDDYIYLGIDVKMRYGKSPLNRDGYGWSEKLKAPYIYLSLGNWSVDIQERQEVSIRDWLQEYTIPHIQRAKPIPGVVDFRHYLVGRIERSINGYRQRLREADLYEHDFGLPFSAEGAELLEEKLAVMQSLFTELQTNT